MSASRARFGIQMLSSYTFLCVASIHSPPQQRAESEWKLMFQLYRVINFVKRAFPCVAQTSSHRLSHGFQFHPKKNTGEISSGLSLSCLSDIFGWKIFHFSSSRRRHCHPSAKSSDRCLLSFCHHRERVEDEKKGKKKWPYSSDSKLTLLFFSSSVSVCEENEQRNKIE